MKSTTYKTLAIISCFTPILCMVFTGIVLASLAFTDYSGKTHPYIVGNIIGRALVALWPLVVGLALGITALTGMRAHGKKGILLPGLMGSAFNAICLFLFIIGLAAGVSDKARELASASKSPSIGASSSAIDKIEDQDYRFELRLPGPGWQLLSGNESEGPGPLSAAGAISPENVACTISIEPTNISEVDAYAQAVADSVAFENKSISVFQEMGFQGYKAIRFTAQGQSAGRLQRFSFLVFLREGFGYRLFSSAPPPLADAPWASATQSFFDAFQALPGAVKAREKSGPTPDFIGIGYQLEQGVYKSLPGRFTITPNSAFQILMPHQLHELNPDAEAGITAQDQVFSFVVISENILGSDPKGFVAQVHKRWNEGLKPVEGSKPIPVAIDSQNFELEAYAGAEDGVENRLGIFVHNSIAYQINAWYKSAQGSKAAAQLPKAISQIHLLEAPEALALESAIAGKGMESEFYISADHSYRNGHYRHYSQGLAWENPGLGVLRVLSGEKANKRLPGAQMYFEDRRLNLHGYAAVEAMGSTNLSASDYHKNLLSNTIKDKKYSQIKTLPTLKWGEALAEQSTFLVEHGVLQLRYWLASAILKDKGFSSVVWMPEALAQGAPDMPKALLGGFSLSSSPFEESSSLGSNYTHHRLGFSFQVPSKGYSFQDERAPSDGRNVARLAWIGPGENSLRAVAVIAPDAGPGLGFALRAMEQKFRDTMNARHPKRRGTLGGRPCEVLNGKGVTTWLTSRGNVIYAVIVSSDDGHPERLVQGFRFQD